MKTLFLIIFLSISVFAENISVFKVEGMHCPLCTMAVKKAVKTLDGIEKVSARLNTKEVTVIYKENIKISDILKAIKTTSYEGVEISTNKYTSK